MTILRLYKPFKVKLFFQCGTKKKKKKEKKIRNAPASPFL